MKAGRPRGVYLSVRREETLAKALGQNVRRLRLGADPQISLESLALACGLSTGYLSRVERAASKRVSAVRCYMIARALGVTLDELFEGGEA